MRQKPCESRNKWQKLSFFTFVIELLKNLSTTKIFEELNDEGKKKKNYQRAFFKLKMEIYHCNNRKGMNILDWTVN